MLWVIRFAPLMTGIVKGKKMRDLPAGTVVSQSGFADGWTQITTKDGITGWMEDKYLETYHENFPVDCVLIADIQTPDLLDPEQYVFEGNIKQVNLCGELCCAYLLKIPLSELLKNWKAKSLPLYKRIFGSGRARGTGAAELVELLAVFGVASKQVTDKTYSPAMLERMTNRSILSVNIDGATGRLRGAGVLHWVVITEVIEERTGYGFVKLYNPFSNRIEMYSYNEFILSARSPYGAVVV